MKLTFLWNTWYKTFLFRPRVFLALSAAAHAGDPPVHHGESVGPGQVPWRMLWALKVTKSGKYNRIVFPPARANHAHANPPNVICSIFHLSTAAFEVPEQLLKARQPRYNTRASIFSLCDNHERCFCVWVHERVTVRVCACMSLEDPTAVRTRKAISRTEIPFSFY